MSETILALRSLAPIIYASTAVVILLLVLQSFGYDITKHVAAIAEKFMVRSKMSRSDI